MTYFTGKASPPVLRHQLNQVICGDLVALLFEERGEARLSVQGPIVVLKHRPLINR